MVLPVNPMNLGRMEKRMALQQELMAAISHEIRTPVARLSFALQLLQDALDEGVENEQQQRMKSSCKGMAQDLDEINDLVAEIMTYIHLEDGGPRIIFQKVEAKKVLLNMCAQYASLNPQLNISVDPLLDDLIIDAEPVQLRRACQNLVGNAINYAKSTVVLGYHLDGDYCVLKVEDDGPGIPEADYGHIFAPFTRLDESRNRRTGGFGLGLSIVRRIAYWHGGRAIAGRSEKFGGANMMIRLPVHQPKGSLQAPSMDDPAGSSA
jgi:two-component system sensor histidine kinase RstB